MAVSHVKSDTIADFTGTVTVFNSVGSTATVAATDLVRPIDWNSAHNQFMTLGGNTLGQSTGSGTNIVFHASGGISIGISNTSQVYISAPINATMSQYIFPPFWNSNSQTVATNGTFSIHRLRVPQDLIASNVRVLFSVSGNTHTSASTNTFGLTAWLCLYTLNGSTLSSLTSTSATYSSTWSTNATSSINGIREVTFSIPATMSPGDYYAGLVLSTSSVNASMGLSIFCAADVNTVIFNPGRFGANTFSSQVLAPGHGIFSTTTASPPASIHVTQVSGSGTYASRAMFLVEFRNTTLL